MERHGVGTGVRTGKDPSHYGKYQVELEAEIPGNIEPIKEFLESSGYVLVDFDQWGLTYRSSEDPDLSADVDELDDYADNIRLVLRKGSLSKHDIGGARGYLDQIYRRIVYEVGTQIAHAVS